jgi:hypothetical protein
LPIRPRFQPLLVGPTGSGKSAIVTRVAAALGAVLVKVCIADWIPVGARAEPATLITLLDLCRGSERVVLFIDELDKERNAFSNTWSQSILAEVFAILDRRPSLSGYCLSRKLDETQFSERLNTVLFVVGAGTWQEVWSAKQRVGFGGGSTLDPITCVVESRAIPEELLLRFSQPPIGVTYPTSDEAEELFRRCGIVELAQTAGVVLDPKQHDFTSGGMRSLENLVTDLLLRSSLETTAAEDGGGPQP